MRRPQRKGQTPRRRLVLLWLPFGNPSSGCVAPLKTCFAWPFPITKPPAFATHVLPGPSFITSLYATAAKLLLPPHPGFCCLDSSQLLAGIFLWQRLALSNRSDPPSDFSAESRGWRFTMVGVPGGFGLGFFFLRIVPTRLLTSFVGFCAFISVLISTIGVFFEDHPVKASKLHF